MLALFDAADDATKELLRSLAIAGVAVTPVVIQYDGRVPDGVLCPFAAYTGLERTGAPLFFDELPVPAWCEIRQGKRVHGEVLRDGETIGRINYEPNSFRQVESVDWLLPDGALDRTDRYDRHGNHYATTHWSDGTAHQTVYRGPGEWAIEVDHVSRAVTMRSAWRLLTFATLTDFVSWAIDDLFPEGHWLAEPGVLINSLSTPLFVARRRAVAPDTTLFWQEPLPGEVPGNMAMELEQPRALRRIVFFDDEQRREVAERHPGTAIRLDYLSHLGRFAEHPDHEPGRVFTLTASDELPGLETLLDALPDAIFVVAAPTLMSERLHGLARRHPNLTLAPAVNQTRIGEELRRASVYLDVNAGPHVLDVVKAAYHLGLVVLADARVAKAPGHSLVCATPEALRARLGAALGSPEGRAEALDELHRQHGPQSTPEDWARALG